MPAPFVLACEFSTFPAPFVLVCLSCTCPHHLSWFVSFAHSKHHFSWFASSSYAWHHLSWFVRPVHSKHHLSWFGGFYMPSTISPGLWVLYMLTPFVLVRKFCTCLHHLSLFVIHLEGEMLGSYQEWRAVIIGTFISCLTVCNHAEDVLLGDWGLTEHYGNQWWEWSIGLPSTQSLCCWWSRLSDWFPHSNTSLPSILSYSWHFFNVWPRVISVHLELNYCWDSTAETSTVTFFCGEILINRLRPGLWVLQMPVSSICAVWRAHHMPSTICPGLWVQSRLTVNCIAKKQMIQYNAHTILMHRQRTYIRR